MTSYAPRTLNRTTYGLTPETPEPTLNQTKSPTHRLHSSSFLGFKFRILEGNPKKELLWSLWVNPTRSIFCEFSDRVAGGVLTPSLRLALSTLLSLLLCYTCRELHQTFHTIRSYTILYYSIPYYTGYYTMYVLYFTRLLF